MMEQQTTPATILVIEDDVATSEYLTFLLEASGYAVQAALSGADGLHVTQVAHLDAILLGRRLPDVDGIALCPLLRQQTQPTTPIVLMTADAEPGLLTRAHEAGATALLRKPFMSNTLLDILAKYL